MSTRQNPLSRLEAFMQRVVEGTFATLFPSKLQPAEVARKLERALEDGCQVLDGGRRLAPDLYDIYVSMKDHPQMSQLEGTLKKEWKERLIQFALHHHYTLRNDPVFRLHAMRDLRAGSVKIETQIKERGEDGAGATQSIDPAELARLRQQLPGFEMGGKASAVASPTQYPSRNPVPQPVAPPAPVMPNAWLTIRSPQIQQKVFRIDKVVVNIGRQLSNDIIVEDKRVSRYHAQIKFQSDGQFTIFDLGSTNGITVNGVPGQRQHMLRNGDRFTIGSYDFYYERR